MLGFSCRERTQKCSQTHPKGACTPPDLVQSCGGLRAIKQNRTGLTSHSPTICSLTRHFCQNFGVNFQRDVLYVSKFSSVAQFFCKERRKTVQNKATQKLFVELLRKNLFKTGRELKIISKLCRARLINEV